ncbi:pyrroloquinoline quinone biosynthesis protein PqqB [Rhizohabitans arisaemae]|uniref:pyrroloquinoline quinone biosynthesis protein PqqB n=1 Tax=Rhizohabitans arisaemae TaxID=2720610 RepID=UPI0024B064D1|nr:MBL fold metallo-hydrolase [Rhizohabitans arisaemae]
MQLRVLGTAAGGGIPQWNCACPGCAGARAHPARRRCHASIAVRSGPGSWYIVNATPDITAQIEACRPLHPPAGGRDTPVRGVILTDAELDHTLGLALLRQAGETEILAAPAVRDALLDRLRLGRILDPYTTLTWRELPEDRPLRLGGAGSVTVRAIPVSGKRPRYAVDGTAGGAPWVIALLLADAKSGASALYAPAVGTWSPELERAAADADCVILDGTFWDDDEPRKTGISPKSATEMGHLPIDGPDGTATRLARLRAARPGNGGRHLYTHLNNTNRLVDPAAPEHRVLAEMGIEVAGEGAVIEL